MRRDRGGSKIPFNPSEIIVILVMDMVKKVSRNCCFAGQNFRILFEAKNKEKVLKSFDFRTFQCPDFPELVEISGIEPLTS